MTDIDLHRRPSENAKFIAGLLCKGMQPTNDARFVLEKLYNFKPGFVHGSVFLLDGRRPINTAVLERFVLNNDAPVLEYQNGRFQVSYNGTKRSCDPLPQPNCLSDVIEGFGPAYTLAQMHSPTTLFLTPLRECIFAVKGEICSFCNFEGKKMNPARPDSVADVVRKVTLELNVNLHIAIGSGTPNLNDGGAKYFSSIARAISNVTPLPISIEMIPFAETRYLYDMRDAGVRSVISSIEIWDDVRRKKYLPGKSRISKSTYNEFWQKATRAFGRGQVSSVLIAGLDTVDSVKQGIDELIEIGVIPTIIPFRPYDGVALADHPVCPIEDYISAASYNAIQLYRSELSPKMQSGCTSCQGCSLDDPSEVLEFVH